MKKQKIIKSFSQLSELNRRDLFKKRGDDIILKPMDKRKAVSIARQLATGFNSDLRKEPTQSEYKRAQRVIKTYYKAVKDKNSTLIRPNKNNRKLYAQASDLPSNFKVYPIPLANPDNKIVITKNKKGKKRLKQIGEFVTYNYVYFNDQKELAKNPVKEGKKAYNKTKKIKGKKQIKIMVGRHLSNATFIDEKQLLLELERYSIQYSNFQDFTRGLQIATFKNQKGKTKTKGK